ncbi:MAG TPA: sulfotransferase [Candidatus Sulfotelmatobacter sp.]|nr:sulfotransferase [Candidatus Sulfotelmatobacter sp.]
MGESDQPQGSPADRLRLLLGTWKSLVRQIDPGATRLTRRMHALYWTSSAAQSLLQLIQNRSFADQLVTTVPPAPLFILGFWRSGTTLLHELLCCDTRFGFPSTYACLNPAHFLLSERWIQSRSNERVRRPMDNLRYSWASPQEDEFALLALGAPSAYQALLVPSLMRSASQLLWLRERPRNDEDLWWTRFHHFLKLLTIQQGKAMVLKSPTHGYRLQILQQRFPESRYVLIQRNPYEVFASNMKLWRTLVARYGLECCSDSQLEEFILAAYVLHHAIVSEGIQRAAPGSFAVVRYEDLVASPLDQISRVYSALGLRDFEGARPRMDGYLAKVSGHTRNHLMLSSTQRTAVDLAWGDIIREEGYSWSDCHVDLIDGISKQEANAGQFSS